MLSCTFIGHKDTPDEIQPILEKTLVDLIQHKNVNTFYVGTHGRFDKMVRNTLKSLKQKYENIDYSVVLAYLPYKKSEYTDEDFSDTIYPEGLETVPSRFAISKRNKLMIDNSDYIVSYVKHHFGNSAQFEEYAEKKNKNVIKLYSLSL